MSTDRYTSPLSERYASKEMQYIFSQDMKFKTWRKLWIALAETEMELGLSENGKPVISQEQIDELKAHAEDRYIGHYTTLWGSMIEMMTAACQVSPNALKLI